MDPGELCESSAGPEESGQVGFLPVLEAFEDLV